MRSMIFLLIFCICSINPAFALDGGIVQRVGGKALLREPQGSREPARIGMSMSEGAYVSTSFRSYVVIDLGSSLLHVKQLTRMKLEKIIERQGTVKTELFLRVGSVKANVRSVKGLTHDFTIRSPNATVAVRGTEFEFDGITLEVTEDKVFIISRVGQTRSIVAGEQSSAPGFFTPTSGEQGRRLRSIVITDTSKKVGEGGSAKIEVTSLIPLRVLVSPTTTAVIAVEWP